MANSNVRPWRAPALFPALMVNPLAAMYVYMSQAMLRLADVMDQMKSSGALKSKDNRSVLPDSEPAKSWEPHTLRLVAPRASKDSARTARARKAHSHKRTTHKV
jgi:hypothetical protein